MNFELAATDAGQSRNPQSGLEKAPGSVCRPAPFAARIEVSLWVATDFELLITYRVTSEAAVTYAEVAQWGEAPAEPRHTPGVSGAGGASPHQGTGRSVTRHVHLKT